MRVNLSSQTKEWIIIIQLIKKYRSVISYLVFGGLTTLINIVAFTLLNSVMNYQVANIIAWFLSVLFAYVTNKIWVFSSKTQGFTALVKEMGSFFIFRGLSLIMDIFMMWLGISILHANPVLTKIVDNIVVVIANYFFSKLYIFKSNK
ncbi:Teichoic acid glycosylation protein [Loigolactobacillus coryniformis subsp. coryniformis CECT 5711]|uniref:Teichoic acid glycosylation protein n=1 Tax=Loigolactobacillus coryniformis subsp. coryniformis CECT 5711 TaxID=1185325 RepID=J2Z431_9LACO|nr:Teichoic acid glycosylation protein [Loigolactobacillus coryniformis subsp. coryniformis CECT 5711]